MSRGLSSAAWNVRDPADSVLGGVAAGASWTGATGFGAGGGLRGGRGSGLVAAQQTDAFLGGVAATWGTYSPEKKLDQSQGPTCPKKM